MKNRIKAFLLGVGDGWRQPHALGSSTNVDHLAGPGDHGQTQEALDRGINLGQRLRSPLRHERF
jgi:hypothetical protein